MLIYGNFEGFPLNSPLFRLVIHHDPPVWNEFSTVRNVWSQNDTFGAIMPSELDPTNTTPKFNNEFAPEKLPV